MEPFKKLYNCSMQVLYRICRLAWGLCQNNLSKFAALKSIYTPQYIEEQLTAIKDAENIEPIRGRNATGSDLRVDAENAARQVCADWQSLKYYIGQMVTGKKKTNALAKAGSASYTKAYGYNWAELQLLMNAGESFIAANIAELTGAGHMPAGFADQFAATAKDCLYAWSKYMTNEGDKRNTAADKNAANTELFTSVMGMIDDAKYIYRKGDPAMKRQFSFVAFRELAAGNGAGSLQGKITDAQTGKAISDVYLNILNRGVQTVTNKRGGYKFSRLAAGDYTVEVSKKDFETQTIAVTVQTSTAATCNIALPQMVLAKVA